MLDFEHWSYDLGYACFDFREYSFCMLIQIINSQKPPDSTFREWYKKDNTSSRVLKS